MMACTLRNPSGVVETMPTRHSSPSSFKQASQANLQSVVISLCRHLGSCGGINIREWEARLAPTSPKQLAEGNNALADRDRGEIDYDRFVTKFTDPHTKDLAIALALRDLSATLSGHIINQDESVKDVIGRFDKIEAHHDQDMRMLREELRQSELRLRAIEREHEREAAVKDRDTARLIWFNRVTGGVIGTGIMAVIYWLQGLVTGRGQP